MPFGRLVTPASTCWTLVGALAKEHAEDHTTRDIGSRLRSGEAVRSGGSLPRVSAMRASTSAAGTHDRSRSAFVALQMWRRLRLAGVAVASVHESRIRIGQQNPLVQLSLNGYFQPRTCVCSRSEQFSFNRTDENRPNRRVSRSDGTRPSAVGIHRASGDIAMLLCQYCCVL
jgi:hypothetical protein